MFIITIFLYVFFRTRPYDTHTFFEFYVNNFTEIIVAYYDLPLKHQLIGIPWNEVISKYTKSHELGYFIRMMQLGFFYNLFIICLNLLVLIYVYVHKNKYSTFIKINMITLTMWHISIVHYLPALKTGPAQLFGLYISILFFFIRYKRY